MKSTYRGRLLASAVGGLLLLTSCAPANTDTPAAPAMSAPPTSTAAPSPSTAPPPPPVMPAAPSPAATPAEQLPAVLPGSAPVTLAIPSIRVTSQLLHLGLEENGSLQVPQDTGNGAPASWYNGSPTPGERGPSVMLGHVNALGGHTGVFADLQKLQNGDQISVTRADGATAVFAVYRGAKYSKNSFPTLEVYGNTSGSELRLITCDGYNPATGEFDDNYVIYAKLIA
ncbi:sortase domain-bontaining protein [Arthrobacter sp. ISL-95]|uniref:sortase domain-containing protein n=1 Tax=Arthrobacter sp. ISL-95 TaxID=2819116 RepID=UPI001BEAD688|nr:sortase [Arthrobacter sp. ISL-95]MBT2585611.1 class F sortase [Arthrobacter sp. ISL-95]